MAAWRQRPEVEIALQARVAGDRHGLGGDTVDRALSRGGQHHPEDPGTSCALGGVSFQLNVEEPHAADSEEIARAVRSDRHGTTERSGRVTSGR